MTRLARAYRWGLPALAFALPLFFWLGLNDTFDLPKLALVYAAIALLLPWTWAQAAGRNARPLFLTGVEGAGSFFLAAVALSLYASIDQDVSLLGFYRVHIYGALPMAAFLFLFWLSAQEDCRDGITLAVMLGGALAGIYGVLQVAGGEFFQAMPRVQGLRPWSSLGNPIYLGAVCMMAFVIAAGEWGRKRYDRLLLGIITAASGAGLVLSLSRSAWLGALSGILFLAGVQKRKRLLALIGGAALLCVIAFPAVRERAATLFSPAEVSNASRLQGWKGALDIWREHPLIGSGPDTFFEAFRAHRSLSYIQATGAGVTQAHAHNDLLQIASTLGLIGLCAFIVMCVCLGRRAVAESLRDPRGPAVCLSAACLSLMVQDQFNFSSVATTAWAALLLGQICRSPGAAFSLKNWPAPARAGAVIGAFLVGLALCACAAAEWRADACFKYGLELEQAGQPVLALIAFRESARWRPGVSVYQTQIGNTARTLAQMASPGSLRADLFQEAWQAAKANTRRHAQDPDAWNNQGVVAMWRNQLGGEATMPEARRAFEQAVMLDPLFVDAWANLAKWRHLQGDLAGEKTLWRKVLAIDPAHPMAHAVLGS